MAVVPDIRIALTYDDLEDMPGARILVDRVWPRGAAGRVRQNSVTRPLGDRPLGNDPDAFPREPVASDGDVPRSRFSTDSRLCATTGHLEAMALYAGQSAGCVGGVVPAGIQVGRMVDKATAPLARSEPARARAGATV